MKRKVEKSHLTSPSLTCLLCQLTVPHLVVMENAFPGKPKP